MSDKSLAERIDVLLERHAPAALAYYKKYNMWPGGDLEKAPKDALKTHVEKLVKNGMTDKDALKAAEVSDGNKRRAPYVVTTLTGDRRRISIDTDDGNVVAGSGATLEEAVSNLEGAQ